MFLSPRPSKVVCTSSIGPGKSNQMTHMQLDAVSVRYYYAPHIQTPETASFMEMNIREQKIWC